MSIVKKFKDKIYVQRPDFEGFSFVDEDTELEWQKFNRDYMDYYTQYFDEMNVWSDDKSIKTFIASSVALDDLFKFFVGCYKRDNNYKSNLFFCKENNRFVGFTYVSEPFGKNKFSTIEYIIVNPKLQRKGYGSRMIKSINSNPKFFSKHDMGYGFVSSVERRNECSRKIFESNEFKVLNFNISSTGREYFVYYNGNKENEIKEDLDKIK